eukprot:TRINITY_DN10642_c0_g1_i1.p1 TRINITY_DN10642_c0_g1~~TRINITY_DN10642_c0_g1_i1.p1  ORF type:complete len:130 (-),score=31.18 TRINITY_DN10642_c0_g1_i1:2-391(-)
MKVPAITKPFVFFLLAFFFFFFVMADENKEAALFNKEELPVNQQPLVSDGVDAGREGRLFEVNTAPKGIWPEVVGLTVEEAEKKIKEEMPMVRFQIVPQDHFVTMDYNQRRVRIFVDSSGMVAKPPRIG